MVSTELAVAANSYQWRANSHEIKISLTQLLDDTVNDFVKAGSCFSAYRKICRDCAVFCQETQIWATLRVRGKSYVTALELNAASFCLK